MRKCYCVLFFLAALSFIPLAGGQVTLQRSDIGDAWTSDFVVARESGDLAFIVPLRLPKEDEKICVFRIVKK